MQTRCPACHTLYRIDEDILKRAGGQARCFRCDTVFDAAAHPPAQSTAAPADATDQAMAAHELAAHEAIDEPGNDAPFDAPNLPDLDGVPDLDVSASAAADVDSSLPFEVPADLPDIEPAPEHSLDAQRTLAEPRPRHLTHTLLPGLLGALLIILALAQLAWFNRTQVLATPLGHNAATALCTLLHCRVPPRRAPSRFAVIDRDIGPDPELPGALVMRLGFSNNGEFAQPLPDIQLSFYDTQQTLMARRRLHPDEYLFPAPPADTLVEPGGVVQVDLRLEDPGRHATGFKLEFL